MKKILYSLLFICLLIPLISSAIEVNFNNENFSFYESQQIFINYSIISDTDQTATLTEIMICDNGLAYNLPPKSVYLTKDMPMVSYFYGPSVDSSFESQNCSFSVGFFSPNSIKFEKNLSIITGKNLDFILSFCKSSSCTEQKKVFIKGEEIYLTYNSSVENTIINATLILPDNTTQQLTLPTSINESQIGTYTLDIRASKEGYKDVELRDMFGVIEKITEIKTVSVCNADGVCSGGENSNNCPQDCPRKDVLNQAKNTTPNQSLAMKETKFSLSKNLILTFVLIGVAIIILIILIVLFLFRKRNLSSGAGKVDNLSEARKFVSETRKAGYKDSEIRDMFAKKGWSEKQIDGLL